MILEKNIAEPFFLTIRRILLLNACHVGTGVPVGIMLAFLSYRCVNFKKKETGFFEKPGFSLDVSAHKINKE
jgi:hypothetical protein